LVTRDAEGRELALTQGMKVLGTEQTASDAEVAAIEAVVRRMVQQVASSPDFRHMAHSDSTSAIISPECGTSELAQVKG